jgi:hypothetical protein
MAEGRSIVCSLDGPATDIGVGMARRWEGELRCSMSISCSNRGDINDLDR